MTLPIRVIRRDKQPGSRTHPEAEQRGNTIIIYDKFLVLDAAQRTHAMFHEVGHWFRAEHISLASIIGWGPGEGFFSTYAQDNSEEGFAEAFAAYFTDRGHLMQHYPREGAILHKLVAPHEAAVRAFVASAVAALSEAVCEAVLPQVRQETDYSCGAAALLAVLRYWRADDGDDEASLRDALGTTRSGTTVRAILDLATSRGLDVSFRSATLADLQAATQQRCPPILALQAYAEDGKPPQGCADGHYVVLVSVNGLAACFMDPASDEHTYLLLPELQRRWHDRVHDGECFPHPAIFIRGTATNEEAPMPASPVTEQQGLWLYLVRQFVSLRRILRDREIVGLDPNEPVAFSERPTNVSELSYGEVVLVFAREALARQLELRREGLWAARGDVPVTFEPGDLARVFVKDERLLPGIRALYPEVQVAVLKLKGGSDSGETTELVDAVVEESAPQILDYADVASWAADKASSGQVYVWLRAAARGARATQWNSVDQRFRIEAAYRTFVVYDRWGGNEINGEKFATMARARSAVQVVVVRERAKGEFWNASVGRFTSAAGTVAEAPPMQEADVALGTVQAGVLGSLRRHGRWFDGCGWQWSSTRTTVSALDALVARGLASKTDDGKRMVYTPVDVSPLAEAAFDSYAYRNASLLDMVRLLALVSGRRPLNMGLVTRLLDRLAAALELATVAVLGRVQAQALSGLLRRALANISDAMQTGGLTENRERLARVERALSRLEG